MKQSVYKFELNMVDRTFAMPRGAKVLSAGAQNGKLMIWVCGEFDYDKLAMWEERTFAFVGTGHKEVEPHWVFIGTVPFHDAALILHVFEDVKS